MIMSPFFWSYLNPLPYLVFDTGIGRRGNWRDIGVLVLTWNAGFQGPEIKDFERDVLMAHKITMKFVQTGHFGRQQKIQLLDDRALRIREKRNKQQREYSIDLLALDPNSQKKLALCRPWLFGSVLTLLAVLFMFWWFPRHLPGEADTYLLLTLVLGSLLITGQLYLLWKYSHLQLIYVSRHAGVPLLKLQVNQPSRKEFEQFVQHLERCIAKLGKDIEIPTQKQLSGELRMLRRLNNSQVIAHAQYEQAKEKLFGRFEESPTSNSQLREMADA